MNAIVSVTALENYHVKIFFDDGTNFTFDVSPYLYGEVFEPLKDKKLFKQVKVDKLLGSIFWNTGADFCPDFLYMEMEKMNKRKSAAPKTFLRRKAA